MEDVPSLVLASVSSVSPVLCTGVTGGLFFGVCDAGKEKLELQLKEPHRHLFIPMGKGLFPSCGRCLLLGTQLCQEHKDQRPPTPDFTGVPPATVILQDKWALAHRADVRVTFLTTWLVHRESSLL